MRKRLVLDSCLYLARHRVAQLLADMADKADRPGEDADPAHDAPVEAELAGDRGDGPGRVDRQRLAERRLGLAADRTHQRDVGTREAMLGRDLEEPRRARIDGLVEVMADAGN